MPQKTKQPSRSNPRRASRTISLDGETKREARKQKIRIAYKARLAKMTEAQLEEFRAKNRAYKVKRFAEMSEERKEQERARIRKGRQKLTAAPLTDSRAKNRANHTNRLAELSDESKEQERARIRKGRQKLRLKRKLEKEQSKKQLDKVSQVKVYRGPGRLSMDAKDSIRPVPKMTEAQHEELKAKKRAYNRAYHAKQKAARMEAKKKREELDRIYETYRLKQKFKKEQLEESKVKVHRCPGPCQPKNVKESLVAQESVSKVASKQRRTTTASMTIEQKNLYLEKKRETNRKYRERKRAKAIELKGILLQKKNPTKMIELKRQVNL